MSDNVTYEVQLSIKVAEDQTVHMQVQPYKASHQYVTLSLAVQKWAGQRQSMSDFVHLRHV